MNTKVIIRADGNSTIGLGHVFRSLALAEMLQNEFECHFVIRRPQPALKFHIQEVCTNIIELPETENNNEEAKFIAQRYLTGNEIVVLDGYKFQTEYQKFIKYKNSKLICIDDIHAYHFSADAIINHIGGITKDLYQTEKETKLFLGPDFSLLRGVFLKNLDTKKNKEEISIEYSTCLLCIGGSDPHNCTLSLTKQLIDIKLIKNINIIIGESYKYYDELYNLVKTNHNKNINIYRNIKAEKIVDLIQRSDFGIFPASTIALEAHSLKLPMLIGYHADNQLEAYNYWTKEGYATGIGDLCNATATEIENSIHKNINNTKFIDFSNVKSNILSIFKNLC